VAGADGRQNAISAASTITQRSHDWVTTSQGDADAGECGGHHRGEEQPTTRAASAFAWVGQAAPGRHQELPS
jgi:hypothetical protein